MVIITSDHGDMLGERGLWFKMSFLERSVRVPLIVHNPGRYGPRRIAEAVSLVDLGPTLVSVAGDGDSAVYPTELDGRSLYPHLVGDSGHDEVLGEYYAEGTTTPLYMVRRGREKFIVGEADPPQMFDVGIDPEELTNLAPTNNGSLADITAEVSDRWDSNDLARQVLVSQHRRAFVSRVMTSQGIDWDFTPTFDASRQYVRNSMLIGELEDRSRFPKISE